MEIINKIIFYIDSFLNNKAILQQFLDNRFFLILLVVFLVRIKYATYRSMWLCAVVNIPGTVLHEFMHFIVGLVTNARPVNFCLLPRRGDDGRYVMGSVGFTNITFYNAFPTAVAPLFLLVIGFYVNRYMLPIMRPSYLNYIGYVLFQTIIIENSIPSTADVRVAFRSPLSAIFYGVILLAIICYS